MFFLAWKRNNRFGQNTKELDVTYMIQTDQIISLPDMHGTPNRAYYSLSTYSRKVTQDR